VYLTLRILRALFGVAAGFQAVGVADLVRPIFINGDNSPDQVSMFAIKTIIFLVLSGIFIGLRELVNYLHKKEFGKEHPALQKQLSL
jgi:hypothetical protein